MFLSQAHAHIKSPLVANDRRNSLLSDEGVSIKFSLAKAMKSSKPSLRYFPNEASTKFELRRTLIVWNTGLALFSIMGACRTFPEFFHVLKNHGLYHSICVPR
ncbi:unnamed protein product [Pieris macdunnoughi]|uniref:Very-long-chain 3-oxoacyl-CoA synthase n=1 Tax=Pieris macdunnoughi TaxID=345717 RepID=A0A821VDI2_9NEOP|nr:unnamed protein product [Pieris macdunnoughi]